MKHTDQTRIFILRMIGVCSALIAVTIVSACSQPEAPHREAGSFHRNSNGLPSDFVPGQSLLPKEGGITSGGSYIYGNEMNPWFLQNTAEVKYCIDLDEQNFGVERAKVKSSITKALALWQVALNKAPYHYYGSTEVGPFMTPWPEVRLGTQKFIETTCEDQDVLLRFQMGKLTDSQRRSLVNPNKFLAATVQTFYDETSMRGQGFVYVSPELGELRPTLKNIYQNHWRVLDGVFLDEAILHELGHVFGFQHSQGGIMSADNLEQVLAQFTDSMIPFFKASGQDLHQLLVASLTNLFEPSALATKIVTNQKSIEALGGGSEKALMVARTDSPSGEHGSIGVFKAIRNKDNINFTKGEKIGALDLESSDTKTKPIFSVKLPDGQTVFHWTMPGFNELKLLGSVLSTTFIWKGTYTSINGSKLFYMKVQSKEPLDRMRPGDELDIEILLDNKIVEI